MAKAQKRVAARKKSSKRGKASVKPTRKMAAKRAIPKKVKSKIPRASKSATKLVAEEKHVLPEVAVEAKVPEMAVETKIMDIIKEPAPEVVTVEERKIA